jgi:hypothetical protein
MPTFDAAAASARERMDWEAMHREQQRQITAPMAEDFKRRDKIRRQHLEDALAAMQPKPSTRTAEEVAEQRARLERLQQTVGLDEREPAHTLTGVAGRSCRHPTVRDLTHICSVAVQSSGFASEKDEWESLARQRAAPGHAER